MTRGRKPLNLDRAELVKIIEELESKNVYENRRSLFEDVGKHPLLVERNIKQNTAQTKASMWKIPLKTKSGKGAGLAHTNNFGPTDNRQTRRDKFANSPTLSSAIVKLSKYTPVRFRPLVSKLREGSMVAALRLKCLDCMNYQTSEITRCPITDCSLWAFRPYQKEGDE